MAIRMKNIYYIKNIAGGDMDRELVEFALLQIFFWAAVAFGMVAVKNKRLRDLTPLLHTSFPEAGDDQAPFLFVQAENGKDAIGIYGGTPIYRYVDIEGKPYLFDRLLISGDLVIMERGERCVAPGLVYRECRDTAG
jgi:hypothetical protein